MEELKKTSLRDTHEALGAKLVDFAGWEMPLEYQGINKEHEMVRNKSGMFDVSHMGEIEVKGEGSEAFLQYLLTNDFSKLKENSISYTPMCYENGGVVDDLLVYKLADKDYLLVVNASNIEKDYEWILKHSKNFDVTVKDRSDEISLIAIQGPKAEEILQKATDVELEAIKFYKFAQDADVLNKKCIVSRTGYTGEDGFEIYCKNEDLKEIWDGLLEIGGEDICPAGLGARDTLRFEAALPLYGHEISEHISPIEGGIGFFVKVEKPDYIGKDVLEKEKRDGSTRKVIGFEMNGKGMPRTGFEIKIDDKVVGFVTTGCASPTTGKILGLGIIDVEHAEIGKEISIAIRKRTVPAVIVEKPFYKKQYKK